MHVYIYRLQTKELIYFWLFATIYFRTICGAVFWSWWVNRMTLSWDSIPQGCAWKWEASFQKVYSRERSFVKSNLGGSGRAQLAQQWQLKRCCFSLYYISSSVFRGHGSSPQGRFFFGFHDWDCTSRNYCCKTWCMSSDFFIYFFVCVVFFCFPLSSPAAPLPPLPAPSSQHPPPPLPPPPPHTHTSSHSCCFAFCLIPVGLPCVTFNFTQRTARATAHTSCQSKPPWQWRHHPHALHHVMTPLRHRPSTHARK